MNGVDDKQCHGEQRQGALSRKNPEHPEQKNGIGRVEEKVVHMKPRRIHPPEMKINRVRKNLNRIVILSRGLRKSGLHMVPGPGGCEKRILQDPVVGVIKIQESVSHGVEINENAKGQNDYGFPTLFHLIISVNRQTAIPRKLNQLVNRFLTFFSWRRFFTPSSAF